MNSRSGPATVVHEVGESVRDVIDCRRWIGVRQDIAERVEGRVPLEGVLVQIWYSFMVRANGEFVGKQSVPGFFCILIIIKFGVKGRG